jgi:hypothetical protein
MSFLDKAKAMAKEAQVRAKDTIEDVQTKRELAETYSEIGRKVVELTDGGQLSHPDLTPLVTRVHELNTRLEEPAAAEPQEQAGAGA